MRLKQIIYFKDFRNYQYTLPVVKGLVVDMEVRKTSIKIPSNRYNEVNVFTFVTNRIEPKVESQSEETGTD